MYYWSFNVKHSKGHVHTLHTLTLVIICISGWQMILSIFFFFLHWDNFYFFIFNLIFYLPFPLPFSLLIPPSPEHLFMCLLATHIPSFVKYMSNYLPIFLVELCIVLFLSCKSSLYMYCKDGLPLPFLHGISTYYIHFIKG